jgi:Family of unknown function (DUF6011)
VTDKTFNAASAFDDLEDETLWADAPSENIRPFGTAEGVTEMAPSPQFKERCGKCQGTGRWGRYRGQCFACKGIGFKVFLTSPKARYEAREKAHDRKVANLQAWLTEHADVVAWVKRRSSGDRPFDFAVSLAASLREHGTLTDGQTAAVRRMIAKDAVRTTERAEARAQDVAAAPAVSIEPVLRAFAKASGIAQEEAAKKGGWLRNLKLRMGAFTVKPAPAHGKNPGALYVVRASDREYLGKLQDGRFQKAFVCTPVEAEAVVAACADPEAATVAFGRLTGACGVCGRRLDNHASIERGIGPICAEKMGW